MQKARDFCFITKQYISYLHGFIKIIDFKQQKMQLTLKAPTPQNDQTHSNNLLATADELFKCVWPLCGVGA